MCLRLSGCRRGHYCSPSWTAQWPTMRSKMASQSFSLSCRRFSSKTRILRPPRAILPWWYRLCRGGSWRAWEQPSPVPTAIFLHRGSVQHRRLPPAWWTAITRLPTCRWRTSAATAGVPTVQPVSDRCHGSWRMGAWARRRGMDRWSGTVVVQCQNCRWISTSVVR